MTDPESSPNITAHPTMQLVPRMHTVRYSLSSHTSTYKERNTNRWICTDTPTANNPYPDLKSQKAFEKGLLEKTAKQTADIILYDNRIVLYKSESDVMMYVVGGVEENEIMLYNVILALRDSLHLLFKYAFSPPPKR
jgi:hypothetical protein